MGGGERKPELESQTKSNTETKAERHKARSLQSESRAGPMPGAKPAALAW